MQAQLRRTDAVPSALVEARLTFANRALEKPFVYLGPAPQGAPCESATYRMCVVQIESGRSAFSGASLDVEGFALAHHRLALGDVQDGKEFSGRGYDEAAELVRQATGAARVVTFDHLVRKRPRAGSMAVQPGSRVHVGYTQASGRHRVRDLLGWRTAMLGGRRAAIINVWRPISHPACDLHVAVCDARTVAPEDLVPTDVRCAGQIGEVCYVAHNDAQRWVYVPDLRPDEALMFKCWDSSPTVAGCVPHAAFEDRSLPLQAPQREGVEFRTLALY